MKLLHIISSLDPRGGGPQEGLKQYCIAGQALGHTFDVACLDAPGADWIDKFPGMTFALGPRYTHYFFARRALAWLKHNVSRYDAVVIHGLWQYHAFAARAAALSHNVPYFVFPHGMLDPWFKKAYPLRHARKWLFWPWGDYRVVRDASAVLFTCEEEARVAPESFWLYRGKPAIAGFGIAPPPNNAPAQIAAFKARFPDLSGKRLLLFLSRIHPKKGCDLLIEAFADIAALEPDLHLVMAGPDQEGWQAALEAVAHRRNIAERVSWVGTLSGEEKWGAFRTAEAFVLPSHQENFGVAVVEAMACGTAVLITDKVNIWREIEKDNAGLVADDSVPGVASLLTRWIERSPDERAHMSKSATASFSNRYQIESATAKLLEIITPHLRART